MKTYLLRILVVIVVLALIVTAYYILSIISTNYIYYHIKKVIRQETIITDDADPLSYFSKEQSLIAASYSHFDIRRQFVFHNFKSGVMEIVFSEDVFDENGKLIHQYKNIHVIIYIEKQGGEWTVTKLKRII